MYKATYTYNDGCETFVIQAYLSPYISDKKSKVESVIRVNGSDRYDWNFIEENVAKKQYGRIIFNNQLEFES